MPKLDRLDLQQIRHSLSLDSGKTSDIPDQWLDTESRQAAVLIPVVRHQESWHLLYIRRAEHEHDSHSGQVAFAGGKVESHDEDLQATALREAKEEIGIQPHDVTILGRLNLHYSISHFRITPVVGHIPWPYDLAIDRREVARAFTIPLKWLADPQNHRIEQRRFNNAEPFPVVHFDEYEGEILWGATARMTLSFISLLNLHQ